MISDPSEFELFENSLFSIADEMALKIFRTTLGNPGNVGYRRFACNSPDSVYEA
jgi:hypothetical protein